MSDISSIRIDNTIYNIKDNNAPRKDEIYTTTEINTLLSAKANISDLGDFATEDDAPSDNNQYARKNGQWDQVTTPAWGVISGTLSNQTDLQSALNTKADLSAVYSKTEADTLLAAKANTADLGGMAAENDAPSDNLEYVRKNGAWAVPSGGGASTINYENMVGTSITLAANKGTYQDFTIPSNWTVLAVTPIMASWEIIPKVQRLESTFIRMCFHNPTSSSKTDTPKILVCYTTSADPEV